MSVAGVTRDELVVGNRVGRRIGVVVQGSSA
jgi:hypothetical protein